MSMLEDILSKAAGKALGVDDDKAKVITVLLPLIVGLVQSGGLEKILKKAEEMGLGTKASSWVGTGDNEGITGDQAKELVGSGAIKEVAEKADVPEGKAADLIAEALPGVIDKLSAGGEVPSADDVGDLLKSLT